MQKNRFFISSEHFVFFLLFCLSLTISAQENFQAYINDNVTKEHAANISVDGKMPPGSIPFCLSERHGFDLDSISAGKKKALSKAIISCTIRSSKEQTLNFGIGADWFFICYVNGKVVLDKDVHGNGVSNYAPANNIFSIPLKQGNNHVAIYLRRGIASWYFSFARLPDKNFWPENEYQRQIVYKHLFLSKLEMPEKPYIFNLSATGCRIGVVFNFPCPAGLRLIKSGEKTVQYKWNLKAGLIAPLKNYVFELDDLTPDTEYKYEVVHVDPSVGGEIVLADGKFRTPPMSRKDHSFYIVNDMQVGSAAVKEAFARIVKSAPGIRKAAFLVSLGDMAGDMNDFADVYLESFISCLRNTHKVDLPFAFVRGNHEYRGSECASYADYFGQTYGSFRVGDVFYFVLDTGEDDPPIYRKNSAKMLTRTDIHFQQQREWLKKVIATPECKTAKYRVVLAHATPFEFENKYFTEQIKILTGGVFFGESPACKLDLWFCGHTHSPFRYDPVSDTLIGAVPRKTKKILKLTAEDKRNIRFPVYVGDGPGGAGERLSCIQVNTHKNGLTVKQFTLDGKVMDHVTFTPGKPVRVHQTTFRPYSEQKQLAAKKKK